MYKNIFPSNVVKKENVNNARESFIQHGNVIEILF